MLVAGCGNGNLYLWDVKYGVILRVFEGHFEKIYSVCLWETHEILIASCSQDNTIRIFDALTGECVCTLLGHRRAVKQIAMYTDYESSYTVLVSCSADKTWRVWDFTSILNKYYYPPLPDNEEFLEDDSELPVGRNNVAGDNPDFEYTGKDGKKKKGSTKAYVKSDDSDEDDEDFYISDSDDNEEVGNEEEEEGGDNAQEGWGRSSVNRRKTVHDSNGSASGDELRSEEQVTATTSQGETTAGLGLLPMIRKSLSKEFSFNRKVAPVSEGGAEVPDELKKSASSGLVTWLTGAGSKKNLNVVTDGLYTDSDSFTPTLPSVISHNDDSQNSTPKASMEVGDSKQFQLEADMLQNKFAQAQASSERVKQKERRRATAMLNQRLSQKRQSAQSSSDQAGGTVDGIALCEGSTTVKPLVSPTRPGRTYINSGTGSDSGNPGKVKVDSDNDSEEDHVIQKQLIKKQHEIHSSRHHTRLSAAQQRATNRLEQRLASQAKKKFASLTVDMQAKLNEEENRVSDEEKDEDEDDDDDDED